MESVTIQYEVETAPNITTVYPNSTGGESYQEAEYINFSIVEPNNQTFNITFTNESAVDINWYVNGTEQIGSRNTSEFNWTGNYSLDGNYIIFVNVSNGAGYSYQYWNMTVNDATTNISIATLSDTQTTYANYT